MIHNPKTGSSFARKVIKAAVVDDTSELDESAESRSLDRKLFIELEFPKRRGNSSATGCDHHGTYSQRPHEFAHLSVVSIGRNPFSHIVSQYEYRHWAKNPGIALDELLKAFPRFPNLSLIEYLRLQELQAIRRWNISFDKAGIGPLSAHFIQMFARDPARTFDAMRGGSIEQLSDHLGSVHFLRQERLRSELEQFLMLNGFDPERVLSTRSIGPSNVTVKSKLWSQSDIDGNLEYQVVAREKALFAFYRQIGIDYSLGNCVFAPNN
jgi:hypothetical protein